MNLSTPLLILLIAIAANADRIVQTTSGPVRGTTDESGKVEEFLGIPYAEPPVGPLRLRKPASKKPWTEVYEANKLPNSCTQMKLGDFVVPGLDHLSEDCLYLNMWVPHLDNNSNLKTIIIFIHGGAFMMGSISLGYHHGAALAKHGDVIVVTINYRLGGLGFFTDFTDDAPGNLGMHDQVAAIRWVKENAKFFQGDPNNIVLMGESAGAFSVSAHLVSPLSRGIFNRAIILSGSVLHPTFSGSNEKLSKMCRKYADILGCTSNGDSLAGDPRSIVECMKNLPAERFIDADTKQFTNLEEYPKDMFSLMFHPRIGDDFLPESIIDSLRNGNFKDTEVLMGITSDEGSLLLASFTPAVFGKYGQQIVTPYLNETLARQFIRHIMSSDDESEDDKIIQTYLDGINEEDEYAFIKAVSNVVGDYLISCSTMFQADIQSLRNKPIFFYVFDFKSPASPSSFLPKWMGVPHGEELRYIFGNFFLGEYSEADKEFSQDLMNRLVMFAKTGNPNISKGVTWPRYTFEDPKYLIFGKQDIVGSKPDQKRCEVWRKRFGSIIDDYLIQKLKNSSP